LIPPKKGNFSRPRFSRNLKLRAKKTPLEKNGWKNDPFCFFGPRVSSGAFAVSFRRCMISSGQIILIVHQPSHLDFREIKGFPFLSYLVE